MDYRDYTHSIQHAPIHRLLQRLNACTEKTTDTEIKEIAKDCLNIKFPQILMFSAHKAIYDSAKTFSQIAMKMDSFSEAQKEITGALNGLNILLKHEIDLSIQKKIKQEISEVKNYENQIQEIFLIKEAIKIDRNLETMIVDPKFLNDFSIFRDLSGRKRELDPLTVSLFMKVWKNTENRNLLQKYLKVMNETRNRNLQNLEKGQIPILEDNDPIELSSHLNQTLAMTLPNEEYKKLQNVFNEIFNNRVSVTNTQIHTDGLDSVFNAQDSGPLSVRKKELFASAHQKYEETLDNLKKQAVTDKTLKVALKNWQKLEGYRPRTSVYYETSKWIPEINAEDPIQPVNRIVGFATKDGRKNESSTTLDFASILGANNLNLNRDERKILSELLKELDTLVLDNPQVVDDFKKTKEIPENITKLLNEFTNSQTESIYPHLETLSEQQKKELVSEGLRFALEVNSKLANDLLTLMP